MWMRDEGCREVIEDAWSHAYHGSPMSRVEAQRIKSIPLCVTDQEDCLSWPRSRSGSYSVKTGYQLLCETEMNSLPSSSDLGVSKCFWKNIWRLKVPNKVKVFLWLACSRALPTKINLQKRRVVDNPTCDQCGCMAEDEFHALWDCKKVREAWTPDFEEVRRKSQRLLDMSDLVSFIMAEGLRLELFAMTAWLIWMRRNKLRMNDNPLPCSRIVYSASAMLAEFQQGKQSSVGRINSNLVRWQPPYGSFVKANFDGAVFGGDQEAGIGVVIRNNEGQVLAALSEKVRMPVSVEILEMLAARKAVIFARDLGFS
nr:putative ribonuclease h protein [Quercus suber]